MIEDFGVIFDKVLWFIIVAVVIISSWNIFRRKKKDYSEKPKGRCKNGKNITSTDAV